MNYKSLIELVMTLAFLVLPLSVFWFALKISIKSGKYFDKSNPDYYKLTMGNPLNALLFKRLRTPLGAKEIAQIISNLVWVWVFSIAILIAGTYLITRGA